MTDETDSVDGLGTNSVGIDATTNGTDVTTIFVPVDSGSSTVANINVEGSSTVINTLQDFSIADSGGDFTLSRSSNPTPSPLDSSTIGESITADGLLSTVAIDGQSTFIGADDPSANTRPSEIDTTLNLAVSPNVTDTFSETTVQPLLTTVEDADDFSNTTKNGQTSAFLTESTLTNTTKGTRFKFSLC